MGELVIAPLTRIIAWTVAIVILGLNAWLLVGTFRGWLT
jgi:manganese transport protein